MDRQELIEEVAGLNWQVAGNGGVFIPRAELVDYWQKLSRDDRDTLRSLTFDMGSNEGHDRGFFAGTEGKPFPDGNGRNTRGAAGYRFVPEEFSMAPNALTTAIREGNEKFQAAYREHMQRFPEDLSLEDARRRIETLSEWRVEQRPTGPGGAPETVAVMDEEMLTNFLKRQSRSPRMEDKLFTFVWRNARSTEGEVVLFGQLAENIAQRQEGIQLAYAAEPSSGREGPIGTIRDGLDFAGFRGSEAAGEASVRLSGLQPRLR